MPPCPRNWAQLSYGNTPMRREPNRPRSDLRLLPLALPPGLRGARTQLCLVIRRSIRAPLLSPLQHLSVQKHASVPAIPPRTPRPGMSACGRRSLLSRRNFPRRGRGSHSPWRRTARTGRQRRRKDHKYCRPPRPHARRGTAHSPGWCTRGKTAGNHCAHCMSRPSRRRPLLVPDLPFVSCSEVMCDFRFQTQLSSQ